MPNCMPNYMRNRFFGKMQPTRQARQQACTRVRKK